jgi:hypothetical protein
MRLLIPLIFSLCTSSALFSQIKIAAAGPGKVLTVATSTMKVIEYHDGSYGFTYQNILSQKPDLITIICKDRAEANFFIMDIKKAFTSKEGNVTKVNYGNSQIALIPASNGSVFMRVEAKADKVSAFEINRFTFRQINILE